MWKEADQTSRNKMVEYKVFGLFTRSFKPTEAKPQGDVVKEFVKYAEASGTRMTEKQLQKFLEEVQGETISLSQVKQVFQKGHEYDNAHGKKGTITIEEFHNYLFCADLNPPIGVKEPRDMDAPLAHYFISTSHNSYLTGDQLVSKSSVRPIIDALQSGVKVIELDLWPNLWRNNVNVRHGRTLTWPVKLIKCLKAINKYAFSRNEYPVVITFEDHLTADLQEKVAKMVKTTFGERLYVPESENMKEFPSPESLKGKILISTKPPKEDGKGNYDSREDEIGNTGLKEELGATCKVPKKCSPFRCYKCRTRSKILIDLVEDEEKAPHQYRRLICIHSGKPKDGSDFWVSDPNKVRRRSLSEKQLEHAASERGTSDHIVRFTQENFLRVYPKGTRLDSSNYDPMLGWTHGAQMVALNTQTPGKNLWVMQGMFRANGGCGYVKKPNFLLDMDKVFEPSLTPPVQKILKVTVYEGQGWQSDFPHTHFDWYSPPDFFVKLGIAGYRDDHSTAVKHETKTISDQWLPVWNEEFEFRLRVPELALLWIEVCESDVKPKNNDFGGQTCLPVSELKTGIRAVPLYDRKGVRYNSVRLLMRFQILDEPSNY